MEKRINKKIEVYLSDFKTKICDLLKSYNDGHITLKEINETIYEYPRCIIDKEELVKRKRVKNTIPVENRCCAQRSSGEQCTRRKREGSDFCGTHSKNAPHGIMGTNISSKIEINTCDINGIIHYIDDDGNSYKIEDILSGSQKPSIIAKYIVKNGNYEIVEYL